MSFLSHDGLECCYKFMALAKLCVQRALINHACTAVQLMAGQTHLIPLVSKLGN